MLKLAYLAADLIGLVFWAFLFYRRKDLRWQMLAMSLFWTPFALTSFLFVPEYWQPITFSRIPVGIEDFLCSFIVGGLSAVLYEETLSKKLVKLGWRRRKKNLYWRFLLGVGPIVVIGLRLLTSWNFMYLILLGLLIDVFVVILLRRDLFLDAVFSGLFFAGLYTLALIVFFRVFPTALSMWALENLSGIILLGVPIEEVLWALLAGAFGGPLYEFWQGYCLKEKREQ